MKKGTLFALALSVCLSVTSHAATIILSLYPNQDLNGAPAPGQFRITAKVLGNDSAGLAGYVGDLTGTILTMDHNSPYDFTAATATKEGPTGFTVGRRADITSPTTSTFISGVQDFGNPNLIPIYALGQAAGSFPSLGITVSGTFNPPSQSWNAELVLAVGTFTGPVGGPSGLGWNQNGPNRAGLVFGSNTGVTVRQPEQLFLVVVPEPTSVAISGFALLGLVACRCARRGECI